MRKIIALAFISIFLVACGGGGSSPTAPNPSSPSASAPTGNFSGQVDPVQTQ